MSASRHPPHTHTATILHFQSDVRLSERPEKLNFSAASSSSSSSSSCFCLSEEAAGISAFSAASTLLLLQLTPLPGPRQRIRTLIYRCWQQPAFCSTPACNTNTPSAGEPTGYSSSARPSGSRAQQTNRCSGAEGLPATPLSELFTIMTQTHHDSHQITDQERKMR